jgi:hypothetical protein
MRIRQTDPSVVHHEASEIGTGAAEADLQASQLRRRVARRWGPNREPRSPYKWVVIAPAAAWEKFDEPLHVYACPAHSFFGDGDSLWHEVWIPCLRPHREELVPHPDKLARTVAIDQSHAARLKLTPGHGRAV